MKKHETIEAFTTSRGLMQKGIRSFNVFENAGYCTQAHVYNRRDFYKISLLQGKSRLRLPHQDVDINRPALVFYNPVTPFAWEPLSEDQPGFFCFFTREFLPENNRNEGLQHSPLFKTGSNAVFFPDEEQEKYISGIFRRMLTEIESSYVYKYDLLRNHLQLIIHEALKRETNNLGGNHKNASVRIASLFIELLERQFPIDSVERSLQLKTAGDYANALSIHVNHLNYAVREVTGQSTSVHIANRILAEAKALLKHTDWPVSQIAYSLGFAYPNYFNNFFKKKTGYPPNRTRSAII